MLHMPKKYQCDRKCDGDDIEEDKQAHSAKDSKLADVKEDSPDVTKSRWRGRQMGVVMSQTGMVMRQLDILLQGWG